MAILLWLVPSRIGYATASRILVIRPYTTCPRDRTYRLFPSDPSFTNLSSVDAPDPLTGHSYLHHALHVFVGTRGLTFVQMSRYLRPTLQPACLQVSVTLCSVVRFTRLHLHRVAGGLPSYTLRTGSGRTDGRDVYGVMRCVPLIVVFGVGTQQPRRPVMTRRPNAGAGGGCYLFPLYMVCIKVG